MTDKMFAYVFQQIKLAFVCRESDKNKIINAHIDTSSSSDVMRHPYNYSLNKTFQKALNTIVKNLSCIKVVLIMTDIMPYQCNGS
jgi:hypothetical protein